MQGQGNYTTEVGQAPYAPHFQHRPVVATAHPPPLPHHSPLHPQVTHKGQPSFHFRPGVLAYHSTVPHVPQQGSAVPGVSSGMSSSQSYVTRPQPPLGNANTQIPFPYPTSDQQRPSWNQNTLHFPPAAPRPASSAYPLASSQEHTLERGVPHQPSFHCPPPPQLPNASSSSSFLRSDPYGHSVPPMRQHSYPQSVGTLLPPPPPPPLPSSSPMVPAIPSSPPPPPPQPPSNAPLKNDGSCSFSNNFILELSPPGKPVEGRSLHLPEGLHHHAEKDDPEVELGDVIVTNSPADSDMDMEDDITLPEEEKKTPGFYSSNDEHISTSQDDHVTKQLKDEQDAGTHMPSKVLAGTHMLSKVALDASVIPSGPKDRSGVDQAFMKTNEQIEQPVDDSPFQHEDFSKPSAPVVNADTGYGKFPGKVNEGTNSFNLLQDYASDDATSDNEGEDFGNVGFQSVKVGSTNSGGGKSSHFGSELRKQSMPESNKNMNPKSMNESISVRVDKILAGARKGENFSGQISRGKTSGGYELKDSSRNHDTDIGSGDAKVHLSDIKCDATKLNVDKFGRLIREGVSVSDSETSDSPRYTRRQARRARKRSRSQSRSHSPHDRRRRRSPRSPQRKERRGRSRSWSPKRRSRSRSPVMRRDIEFSGDKQRREKGQVNVCFNFRRGKCYRGTSCRYSHHEPDKGERKGYSRGKNLYRDKPPVLQSPHSHVESNRVPEKEVKLKGLKELNELAELQVDSTACALEKDEKESSLPVADVVNLTSYPAHDVTSGKEDSLITESPMSDKMHQPVNQHGHHSDSLFSEPSVMDVSVAASGHVLTCNPDAKEDNTPLVDLPGNSNAKPFTKDVTSRPLKELLPSADAHISPSLHSVSQMLTQPLAQDYSMTPSVSRYHAAPEKFSPYRAPVSYQPFHFPGPSNSSSSSFVLSPHPLPPPPSCGHLTSNVMTGEHNFPSPQMQHSLLPPQEGSSSNTYKRDQSTEYPNRSLIGQFEAYSTAKEPDQMVQITNNFDLNLSSGFGGPPIREDHSNGHPIHSINPSQSFAQVQTFSLSNQSLSKGMQDSNVQNPLSDSARPYLQQTSYVQQYSVAAAVSEQLTEPAKLNSSMSSITPEFLERNQPYLREIMGSRISNHFNPYASTFDLPPGPKFTSNALTQVNDSNINNRYGAPFALTSALGDGHKIEGTNMVSLSCGFPDENAIPRSGGDQYDPLFDSIEPATNSFTRIDHQKNETVGDSDDVLGIDESGRILDTGARKQVGETAVSASDSVENEEFGETADAEVGAVLTGSPSDPNDAANMNAGDVEINQVKKPGKKKKSKEKSMKLFKVSIAAFVKEVLKPSWRQGNMSKEAFKTIVKKTVDKVSGAMKSHRIPRSQTRINQYIDSSRGKLTKLVMGYVDKYVKV